MPRPLVRGLLAGAFVLGSVGAATTITGAGARDVDAFEGLGAWIDVFDYVPEFNQRSGPVAIAGDTIDDLVALGVETIYLQVAIDDPRAKGLIVDRKRVGEIVYPVIQVCRKTIGVLAFFRDFHEQITVFPQQFAP